ncbi:hypothetical protein OIV83_002297 [Microbotryomycetes sp. JL201]|nr:hypothetical protein OIV83_002297 [Microbotryomycetes sp. JL201]
MYRHVATGEPLPTRSPASFDRHSTPTVMGIPIPGALVTFVRTRLFLSCMAGVVLFMSLLSYATTGQFALIPNRLATQTPAPTPLNPNSQWPEYGLQPSLWRELAARSLRQFVLEPHEVEWIKQPSPDDAVPWTLADLIPKRADNLANYRLRQEQAKADGSNQAATARDEFVEDEVIPRHRIDTYPRLPVVPVNAPAGQDLIFGFTTTVERAKIMSELWTRFLKPTDGSTAQENERNMPACLILLSKDESPIEIQELKDVLKSRGLKCGVKTSNQERYEVRVLSLIVELPAYAKELKRDFKWFVFNDDDTFWLDQRALRRLLAKYDPLEQLFIGATSEAKNQLDSFGRMAFGGAGMLVSQSLMNDMHGMYETCHTKFKHIFGGTRSEHHLAVDTWLTHRVVAGDEMVTRCAALAKGETKQTVTSEEKGLHQFDIPGDTTGVLQSGIPFLNLHHYLGGSWVHLFGYGSYRSDMSQILLLKRVVSFLGSDNMFKRYVFGDGKWLFVNGYSITFFEQPLTRKMMNKMEHTWYEGYRLSFDDRPAIPERHDPNNLPCKQTFYIDDLTIISPRKAVFTYISADKWDEHLTRDERVQLNVTWDECWDSSATSPKPGC